MLRIIAVTFVITIVIPLCSHASTIQLPRTGQAACYDASGNAIVCSGTGQDGAIQAGKPWSSPRFVDNGNGTVTDNLTGLVWLKNANCTDTVGGIAKSSGSLNWSNAITWSNNLQNGACGLSDGSVAGQWRLPNQKELASLTDASRKSPALPAGHFFINVPLGNYIWSSSTSAFNTESAWVVYMYDGYMNYNEKENSYYVWPVRDGQ